MFRVIIFFLLLVPVSCLAQFTISGRVLNQVDAKPVANTSVFLSNATIGAKTAEDGTFTLNNVSQGKYALIVSNVAYEAYSQNILVSDHSIKLETITIFPKTRGLKEVTITVDPNRSRYLSWFKDAFIGRSELAQGCKILNPDILDLDYDEPTNTLTASAPDFLEIENDALGYKVKYLLKDFMASGLDQPNPKIKYEGSVLFEPLKGSTAQQKRWLKIRQETYEGSEMHFFRSVLRSRIDQENYRILQLAQYNNIKRPSDSLIETKIDHFKHADAKIKHAHDSLAYWIKKSELPKLLQQLQSFPLNKGDLVKPTDQPGIYALGCELDGLYITHDKDRHFPKPNLSHLMLNNNYQTSNLHYDMSTTHSTLVSFNQPYVYIDLNGIIANPYSISFDGEWAMKRIADLLPLDYEPPLNENMQMDSTVSKNVTAKLNSFSEHNTTEKAYLHFDKPYYAAGDTMYFKAYLTSGGQHQLSNLSGVLHVDLVNTANKIDQSINLEVIDGVTWGDFALPDSLKNGGYRVRAYTNLMRNDGDLAFFDQPIPVGFTPNNKVPESSAKSIGNLKAKPDIQFFPEGGELVMGIQSKVAFKAINSNGSGIGIKGEIIDNDNKEVASLASAHLGMGYFYLTPQEGKTYKAKLIYADGTQAIIDIPVPAAKGIALSVNNGSAPKVPVKILSSQPYYKENKGKYYTLVTYSGGTAKSTIFKLDNPEITIDISKRGLSSGVASITLFSSASEPLCERLFFIENDDQLKMGISSDKAAYAKKDKVNVKLNTTIKGGEPAQGHFSVAVIDEGRVPVNENTEITILTDLLLTSDLKGYVEQPNYYFNNINDSTRDDLDLVMLTHGYRKFDWKQVFDNNASKIAYQHEKSLELAGTIKTFAGKPIPTGGVILLATRENVTRDTTADANGNFRFTDLYLSDTSKIILRARKSNNSGRVDIEVKPPDYPAVTKANGDYSDTSRMSSLATGLMQKQYEQKRSMQSGIILKQVNIKSVAAPARPVVSHSANLNGPGEADFVIMGDKLTMGCANLIQCLQSLIPGGVKYVGPTPLIYNLRTPISLVGKTPPMIVILDGLITDQSIFNSISPTDIYSIEVLESSMYLSVYGTAAAGGAIVITTKHGSEVNSASAAAQGLITYRFKGFYKAREFYAPKYDHPAGDAKPDLRTTIFWKPEVITDKDGNASFDYYNADTPGTYRVVIEGIDVDGNIGRQVYRYKVE